VVTSILSEFVPLSQQDLVSTMVLQPLEMQT